MKYESGRSMIEMLGVLAIMGIITVGAIGMISTAMRTQKRNTVNEEVLQIVTGVRQLLGGTYELAVDPTNNRQFIVTITGLSDSDCEYFVTKAWSDSVGYLASDGKQSGASGNCNSGNGKNVVKITYGE